MWPGFPLNTAKPSQNPIIRSLTDSSESLLSQENEGNWLSVFFIHRMSNLQEAKVKYTTRVYFNLASSSLLLSGRLNRMKGWKWLQQIYEQSCEGIKGLLMCILGQTRRPVDEPCGFQIDSRYQFQNPKEREERKYFSVSCDCEWLWRLCSVRLRQLRRLPLCDLQAVDIAFPRTVKKY